MSTGIEPVVILPPSKEEKLRELAPLSPEQQVEHVTEMLVSSNAGLLVAIAAQDLPGIVRAKQQAATIQEIAKQVRIGKDMQLHAAEFCRRAERGLADAVVEGQEGGTVATKSSAAIERRAKEHGDQITVLPRVRDIEPDFYANSSRGESISDLAGLRDDQFEDAISEARDEGNLSRANVARKCKAKVAIPDDAKGIDNEVAPKPKQPAQPRPFKKTDTEMLAEMVGSIQNFAGLIEWVRPEEIDDETAQRLVNQARSAWGAINKKLKEIKK